MADQQQAEKLRTEGSVFWMLHVTAFVLTNCGESVFEIPLHPEMLNCQATYTESQILRLTFPHEAKHEKFPG